jgi:hypothetical protein
VHDQFFHRRLSVLLCALWFSGACSFESAHDGPPLPPRAADESAGSSGASGVDGAGFGGASPTLLQAGVAALNPESILAAACFKDTNETSLLPTNILFVVDRSSSMACNPPPTTTSDACEAAPKRADATQPSKWELTSSALRTALDILPDSTFVGVSYFSNNDECGVTSIPNVRLLRNTMAQRTTIDASLMNIQPGGATPLVGATILAYRYMHDAALGGAITGNQYVVLITDGQQSESCSDPTLCSGADACTSYLLQKVGDAAADGVNIRTFVIGAPGSEHARSILSRIAQNGGTAPAGCDPAKGDCHFDVTTSTDLSNSLQLALRAIAQQTLTCDLPLPQPTGETVDPTLVNLVYTPLEGKRRVLPQDTHAPCESGADGWQYNAAGDQIRLCGNTCATIRSDRGARIDVVLGCPVITPG